MVPICNTGVWSLSLGTRLGSLRKVMLILILEVSVHQLVVFVDHNYSVMKGICSEGGKMESEIIVP